MAFWLRNKKEVVFLLVLLLVGGFLRLYRLRSLVQFYGDQGRDAIIAKKILIDHDLRLIGPVTSVGNMHLGPFYYYFMVPWLALTYPDPIGPAVAVAIVGTLTLLAVYFITKEMYGVVAGSIAALLYALAQVVITNTRFSWNPNLAPIVGLLIFYGLYKVLVHQKYIWIFWSMVLFGLIIQLHYVSLLLGVVIMVVVGWCLKEQKSREQIIKYTLGGIIALGLLSLPLVVFDLTHGGINFRAFQDFFASPQEHIRPVVKIGQTIKDTRGRAHLVLAQLIGSAHFISDQVIVIVSLLGAIWVWLRAKSKQRRRALVLLFITLGISILGISFYSSPVFSHYLGFLFTMPFMLTGIILAEVWQAHWVSRIVVVGVCIWLAGLNLITTPALATKGRTIDEIKVDADKIASSVSPDVRYNVALLSLINDYKAMNYRYFLVTTDHPPESEEDYEDLDELYVIVEPPYEEPLEVDVFEIQYPGLKKIDAVFEAAHQAKIYKLVL